MRNATTKAAAVDLYTAHRLTFLTLLTVGIYLLMESAANAQVINGGGTSSPMGEVLCNAVAMVMGDLGRGLATLAVIAVGIGALIGKASWGMALTVATGIAVVFGAPGIVAALGVEGGGCSGGSGGGLQAYYSGFNAGGGGPIINTNGLSGSGEVAADSRNILTTVNNANGIARGLGNLFGR